MVQIFANPPEKPMPSIVQTLHLRGAKNPEKVDAVGLQPTASIPFLQYGGDTQIRTGGGAFAEHNLQSATLTLAMTTAYLI